VVAVSHLEYVRLASTIFHAKQSTCTGHEHDTRAVPIRAEVRIRPIMKPSPTSHASLRTKTGCLTCRSRKIKCDEQRPKCACCVASQRVCTWPTIDLLVDRRNRARHALPPRSDADQHGIEQTNSATCLDSIGLPLSTAGFDIVFRTLETGLEVAMIRHFVDDFYPHLINLDCDRQFRLEWLRSIQEWMPHCMGLRYSVLANAASNLFLAGQCSRMRDLALHYYTRSLRGLATTISQSETSEWKCGGNDVLTSMIFLYLHGNMGNGTYDDISIHVNAAVQVLERRFFKPGAESDLKRPVDRLVVESVIYHVFQIEMGFWSDASGKGPANHFNPRFWLKCEGLLRDLSTSPGLPDAGSSPVLGIPMAVYKLMLIIRKLWTMDPKPPDFYDSLSQLETELGSWRRSDSLEPESQNSLASCQSPMLASSSSIVGHATTIMVICASLLAHQLRGQPHSLPIAPTDHHCGGQVDTIVSILRSRKGDLQWTSCYVGTYPIYVAGYFMRSEMEIELVRAEMRQRYEGLHWGQVSRYWEDLETVWRTRSKGIDTAR
jgi:hypothetical protein